MTGWPFWNHTRPFGKANKIEAKAVVQRVELDDDLRHGFFVRYDNGQTAEVSWAFIRELPPGK